MKLKASWILEQLRDLKMNSHEIRLMRYRHLATPMELPSQQGLGMFKDRRVI
jgi:hypothetical protein